MMYSKYTVYFIWNIYHLLLYQVDNILYNSNPLAVKKKDPKTGLNKKIRRYRNIRRIDVILKLAECFIPEVNNRKNVKEMTKGSIWKRIRLKNMFLFESKSLWRRWKADFKEAVLYRMLGSFVLCLQQFWIVIGI